MSNVFSVDAVNYACDRIDTFALVNYARSQGEKADGLSILLDSLGIDDKARDKLTERINVFIGPAPVPAVGAVMTGVLLGLFLHQYEEE